MIRMGGRELALGKLLGPIGLVPYGIISVCSAHPMVLEATLLRGRKEGVPVLIEATCNQVNQDGGYTGMTPADFRRFVEGIAEKADFPADRITFGGDHLGPNPWRGLDAEAAMSRAEAMVAAYVDAGFHKIHLDTSMGCRGEPGALADEITAGRAARLAGVAEAKARQVGSSPVYVIGTEVPPPGGARHRLEDIEITAPEAVRHTYDVHRRAFADAGVSEALERVIGIVVQPGVEFGNTNVVIYRPERAAALSRSLTTLPGLVFEAHSTDYQPAAALEALVADGFAILKVGPGLTFALREALYGLDAIRTELTGSGKGTRLEVTMESLMLRSPQHWHGHYGGTAIEQRLQRHFSYSDRIRYYWPDPQAAAAVDSLLDGFADKDLPETLISQHLGRLYPYVLERRVAPRPRELCTAAVDLVLDTYYAAVSSAP